MRVARCSPSTYSARARQALEDRARVGLAWREDHARRALLAVDVQRDLCAEHALDALEHRARLRRHAVDRGARDRAIRPEQREHHDRPALDVDELNQQLRFLVVDLGPARIELHEQPQLVLVEAHRHPGSAEIGEPGRRIGHVRRQDRRAQRLVCGLARRRERNRRSRRVVSARCRWVARDARCRCIARARQRRRRAARARADRVGRHDDRRHRRRHAERGCGRRAQRRRRAHTTLERRRGMAATGGAGARIGRDVLQVAVLHLVRRQHAHRRDHGGFTFECDRARDVVGHLLPLAGRAQLLDREHFATRLDLAERGLHCIELGPGDRQLLLAAGE
jgi:hypothetical protein